MPAPKPQAPKQVAAKQPEPKPEKPREKITDGTINGNLTFDPELRYTPTGIAVCTLRVAETERVKNEDGTWSNGDTYYYDVECWRGLAENVAESLQKGDRIVASGTFWKRYWTNKEGEEQEAIYLSANDVGPSLVFRTVKLDRTQRSKSL